MLDTDTVLSAIGSQEPSSFQDLCQGLGADIPHERSEWADLFRKLEELERDELVEIDRVEVERNGRMRKEINTVILTAGGAEIVRAKLDKRRGLLSIEGV